MIDFNEVNAKIKNLIHIFSGYSAQFSYENDVLEFIDNAKRCTKKMANAKKMYSIISCC